MNTLIDRPEVRPSGFKDEEPLLAVPSGKIVSKWRKSLIGNHSLGDILWNHKCHYNDGFHLAVNNTWKSFWTDSGRILHNKPLSAFCTFSTAVTFSFCKGERRKYFPIWTLRLVSFILLCITIISSICRRMPSWPHCKLRAYYVDTQPREEITA